MKRVSIRALFAMFVASVLSMAASAITQIDINHDTSGATLGRWTSDYVAVTNRMTKEHIPVIAFWGSEGCGWCARMKRQGLVAEEFLDWVAKKPILMLYTEVLETQTGVATPAKVFTKGNNTSGLWPYMRLYWAKKDGTIVSSSFTGRAGYMPVKDGTTAEQLVGTLDKYFGSWTGPEPDYLGGYFSVTNNAGSARFEAIYGQTKKVTLPLYRTVTGVATNKIKVGSSALANVIWGAKVTNLYYSVAVPTNVVVGKSAAVNLYDYDGKTLKSSTAINVVKEPAVSVTNPKWIGEAFTTGQWTMNLDAALAKAKTAQTYTLALASGTLWCPWCKSLESKILSTTNFTNWAKNYNVNLVILDNPKRSASDVKDASGMVTSVGKKADGAGPTLLRYDVVTSANSDPVSGTAYMSRKGVVVGSTTTAGTAEYVLQRNHDLLYAGGKLAAPEAMRTGYPTFILVNSDGTAAAQMLDGCADGRVWGLSVDETLARLDELLKLSGGNMTNSAPSTTKLSLAVEGTARGQIQVNAGKLCYKLTNVPSGKVTFTASGVSGAKLSVYETTSTIAKGKLLASGTNSSVTVTFANGSNKYLLVDGFPEGTKAYGRDTEKSVSVSSVVTLVPTVSAGSFTSTSGSMKMAITAGVQYKLSGFSSYGAFTSNGNGLYTAKSTGTVAMSATSGTKVTYQIWKPGTIQFTTTNGTALESDGSVTVKVSRTNGSSGASSVTLTVNSGSKGSKRVSVSPATLSWADGDSTTKTVTLKITTQTAVNPDEIFTVKLATGSGSSASVGAASVYTLSVSDSADPVLEQAAYKLATFKGFALTKGYKVQNVKDYSKLTISTSGTIPRGINVGYSSSTGMVTLSGTPSRVGTYTFTVKMSEERSDKTYTGSAVFTVTVADATKLKAGDPGYNELIAAHKAVNGTLPIYGQASGEKVLAGSLYINISTALRVRATYTSATGSKLTFRGTMTSLDEDGTATTSLSSRGAVLQLTIPSTGRAIAYLTGLDGSCGSTGTTGSTGVNLNGKYANYAGYYLVTLPCETDGLESSGEVVPTGTGYVILKMNKSTFNSKGLVSYSGMLPNGTTFSGSAYLSADQYQEDGYTWAVLPIVVKKSSIALALPLRIRMKACADSASNPMAVMAESDCVAFANMKGYGCRLTCYGSCYSSNGSLYDCCSDNYETTVFDVVCVTNWFKASEAYGSIARLPKAIATVSDGDSLSVVNEDSRFAFTMKLMKSSGLVSGRFPIQFSNGRKITATYKGVILPGWSSCNDCSDTVVNFSEDRPLFSGAAYFSDRVNGVSLKRGFAVELK